MWLIMIIIIESPLYRTLLLTVVIGFTDMTVSGSGRGDGWWWLGDKSRSAPGGVLYRPFGRVQTQQLSPSEILLYKASAELDQDLLDLSTCHVPMHGGDNYSEYWVP